MPTDKPTKPALKGKHAHRVAFLAARERIDGFLREGYSWKAIYDFFVESSAFSMSYSTFCRYMNGLNKPIKKRVETTPEPSTGSMPSKQRRIESEKNQRKPVVIQQPKDDAFSDKTPTDKDNLV